MICVSVATLLVICLCLDAVHPDQKICVATLPEVSGGLQYNAFVSGCGACSASPLFDARHYTTVHLSPPDTSSNQALLHVKTQTWPSRGQFMVTEAVYQTSCACAWQAL